MNEINITIAVFHNSSVMGYGTLNNASDYQTNRQYRTHNPNSCLLVR